MIRLDRSRLETATFADWFEIQTRFDDLDTQGHINNAVIVGFFQEARGRFRDRLITRLVGPGRHIVIGSMLIDYAGEMTYPEPVEIGSGVLEIGRSSLVMAQVARQNGRIVAFVETKLVYVVDKAASPLPDDVRAQLEDCRL